MGRNSADDHAADSNPTALRPVPAGPVVISVCTTCKFAEGGVVAGPQLLAAVTSPDGRSSLFDVLQAESGAAA